MRCFKILTVAAFALMLCALSGSEYLNRRVAAKVTPAPPVSVTGAPDEGTCFSCHYTYELNSGVGTVYLTGLPAVYAPGQTYTATVTVADPAAARWGFELTAIDNTGTSANAGALAVSDLQRSTKRPGTTDSGYARTYLSHYWGGGNLPDGSYPGQPLSASWTFTWTAPAAAVGDVTFYAAGNSAEYGVSPEYDYIRTTSFKSRAPIGVTGLSSYVDLKGTTQISFTVYGVFDAGSKVLFNNQEVTSQAVTGGLMATIPADLLAVTGVFPVSVRLGNGTTTNSRYFVLADRFTTWNGVTTVEAASYQSPVTPGEIVAAFGTEFNTDPVGAAALAIPLPTSILNSRVFVNGVSAPLYFVRNNQINYQIPYGTETGSQTFVALSNDGIGSKSTITVASYAPAIFAVNQAGTGQASALNAVDYSINNTGRKVKKGEYVAVYATGASGQLIDNSTRAPLQGVDGQVPAPGTGILVGTATKPVVTIGGKPAEVVFSGLAPGYVGLWQLNVKVPVDAPSGDAVSLILKFGDRTAQSVTIAVQ